MLHLLSMGCQRHHLWEDTVPSRHALVINVPCCTTGIRCECRKAAACSSDCHAERTGYICTTVVPTVAAISYILYSIPHVQQLPLPIEQYCKHCVMFHYSQGIVMCMAGKQYLWMTPRPAVALNLAQFVARDSQSRFSRRKASTVVPECMVALANMTAE